MSGIRIEKPKLENPIHDQVVERMSAKWNGAYYFMLILSYFFASMAIMLCWYIYNN